MARSARGEGKAMAAVHTVPSPTGSGWVNEQGGRVVSRHRNKQNAIQRGREIARRHGALHAVHTRDGAVAETVAYAGDVGRPVAVASTPQRARAAEAPPASLYGLRIESARRAFPSDAQVADALGVDRAQLKRWREGRTEPSPENADRIVGLDTAVELLSGYLEPSSIGKWLTGINAHLGDRRPIDLLRQGSLSDVIAAIEALKSGSYA